ncbi:MAG TPA: hypothetical protein VH306_15125 [Gaiellaceae bacterium]
MTAAVPTGLLLDDLVAAVLDDPLLALAREDGLDVGREEILAVLADEALAGRIEIRLRPEPFGPKTVAALASLGDGERVNGVAVVPVAGGTTSGPSGATLDDALADDVARLLADEPTGLSCDAIAKRLRRRRPDVVAALRADDRFVRYGKTHGARWRLAQDAPESRPIPTRGDATVEDVLRVVRELQRLLGALIASEARA